MIDRSKAAKKQESKTFWKFLIRATQFPKRRAVIFLRNLKLSHFDPSRKSISPPKMAEWAQEREIVLTVAQSRKMSGGEGGGMRRCFSFPSPPTSIPVPTLLFFCAEEEAAAAAEEKDLVA